MARNNYPGAKTEAGIVIAYNCNAPCGGWVVLYDREKGAQIGLRQPIEQTGRYVLVHYPSKNCLWPFENLAQAKEYTRAAAKGEDPTGGLLPRTTKPTKAEKESAAFIAEGKAVIEKHHAASAESSPPLPVSSSPSLQPPPPPPSSFHLDFKRAMLDKFTPSIIVEKLDDLLNAVKPVALTNLDTGEKETVDTPDWMAREKGIRLVIEMNEGKAKERPDVKEPVKKSFADLDRQLRTQPKSLEFMINHCASILAEQRAQADTHASSPAKTKAKA